MIEIQDLYKYYGDRRAIGPLTTRIEKGHIVGLLGLNGAGKTTTLRVLACDLLPTSGTVKVGGVDVVERPDEVRAKVGYLPDRPPLYDDMTVREYLEFVGKLRRIPSADLKRRVSDVEELTEVGRVANQMIGTLSHGYRQRVGIAQAIVHKPALVVLDEPISGLDPVQIADMRDLVRSLRGDHTVMISSHILPEISETCDEILVIQDGRIGWSGTEAELAARAKQGLRINLTLRARASIDRPNEAARSLLTGITGVSDLEILQPTESGAGIVSVRLALSDDVRDVICEKSIGGGFSVLELARERELESMFFELLGEDAEAAAQRRRGRKRRQNDEIPEPEAATDAATKPETPAAAKDAEAEPTDAKGEA